MLRAPGSGTRLRRGVLVAVLCSLGAAGCAAAPEAGGPAELVQTADKARVSQHLAEAARQGGDYAGAIELYRRMLQAGGDPLTAHLGLGDCYLAGAVLDEAEKEYQAAAVLAPNNAEAQLGLGRVLLGRHRPEDALAAFDRALARGGARAAGLNGKGLALDLEGRHADAQAAYRDGLGQAPQDRVLRSNYGLSLALTGNYDAALGLLAPLAQGPAATARNRANLALALGLKGDTTAARTVALEDLSPQAVDGNLKFYEAARLVAVGQTAGTATPQ